MQRLAPIIQAMKPISLQEMSAVKMMNRIDTKFLLSKAQLLTAFAMIRDGYMVQTIDGEAIAPYHTLYFDTPDVAMYTMHHNRKLHRQKLRVRQYRQNNTTFFELKDKNNRGKTEKTRIPVAVERFNDCLTLPEVGDFVTNNTPYTVGGLLPQVENHFNRITLANNALTERVTIDSDITFANRHTGLENHSMADLVIVEVKQDPAQRSNSLLMRVFSQMRIQPKRVSKYCLGTVLTNPDAKYNRYKEKLRYIEKQLKVES
ncbi:MAG: polyphosphate polymerase domain-containing protein [Bacteroidales bacterium]|nr:polyphosphate polymerase domain-containing protein [Bacteroidales bacterium]